MAEGKLYATKDIGFEQQYRASKTTLYSAGLNAKWDITDELTLNLDGNTSRSKSVPDSPNGATSTLVGFGAPVGAPAPPVGSGGSVTGGSRGPGSAGARSPGAGRR